MSTAMGSTSITNRMIRAAKLDAHLYEEVEADSNATSQALTVVVLATLAAGISAAISAAMAPPQTAAPNPIVSLISGVITALIGWAVWSYVNYFVGTRLMGGVASYGELLRTLGFAYTPGLLAIFGFIPVLGPLIGLISGLWSLATGFVAIRQALDLDNGKTIATIVVSIVALILVLIVVGIVLAAIGLGGALLFGR